MRILLSLLAGVVLLSAGCAYRLGSTTAERAGERTLTVAPVVNRTLEPGVSDALAQDLRALVQRDGTFKLDTRNEGDVVLTTTVTGYSRNPLSFQPRNVLAIQDYRLTLTAQVVARERTGGKVLMNKTITGFALVRVGDDLTASERQALPLATSDLALNIVTVLVDGSW